MFELDLSSIKESLALFKESIGLLKSAKDLLPESHSKSAAEKSLIAAESAAQIAEANIAKAFGYPLCHCSFPPGIMTLVSAGSRRDLYHCPKCNEDFFVGGKLSGKPVISNARES